MTLVIVADLLKAGGNSRGGGVSVDRSLHTIDLDVAVGLGGLDLGGALRDVRQGRRDLAVNGGNHSGIGVALTADACGNGLELADGGVHRRGVIGVILNPLGDLSQGVQGILGALRNQLRGQLLIGDGTGALSGVGADQGSQISAGGLGVQNRLQSGVQISLRHLSLVGQSGKPLHRHINTVDSNSAVSSAGGDQDVHHLVGDGQRCAVDLNAHQRLGFDLVDLSLGALGQHFQLVKSGVLRHKYAPPLKNICLRLFAENSIENVLHLFVGGGIIRVLRIVRVIRRRPIGSKRLVQRLVDFLVRSRVFPDDLQNLGPNISSGIGGRDQLGRVDSIHDAAGQAPNGVLLLLTFYTVHADMKIDSRLFETLGRNDTAVVGQRYGKFGTSCLKDSRLGVSVPALVKNEFHNVDLFGVLHQAFILEHVGVGFFHCNFHGLHLLTE